jgi:thymidylate synthase (FAD)
LFLKKGAFMELQAFYNELARINKWKYLRKDLFRNVEPQVELVALATPTYALQGQGVTNETLPAFTARQSHESKGDHESDLALNQNLIAWGHTTPLEALTFTFGITGISKSLAGQWTRHRVGIGWTFRSTRYVDSSTNGFVYPALEYLNNPKQVKYIYKGFELAHSWTLSQINVLKQEGVNKQECRRLQPVGFATAAYAYTNARALRHFFSLRLDSHAEWEIRRLAILIYLKAMTVAPSIFGDIKGKF